MRSCHRCFWSTGKQVPLAYLHLCMDADSPCEHCGEPRAVLCEVSDERGTVSVTQPCPCRQQRQQQQGVV